MLEEDNNNSGENMKKLFFDVRYCPIKEKKTTKS